MNDSTEISPAERDQFRLLADFEQALAVIRQSEFLKDPARGIYEF